MERRLIDATDVAPFEEAAYLVTEPVLDLDLRSPEGLARWQVEDSSGARPLVSIALDTDSGLTVPPGWFGKWLQHPLRLSARSLDEIEIDLDAPSAVVVTLCWAGPEQWFVRDRCLSEITGSDGPQVLRFKASTHPDWRGDLRWLGLSLSSAGTVGAKLRGLRGSRYRPGHGPEDGWPIERSVSLSGDERPAWLTTVPGSIEVELLVPLHGRLDLSLGSSPRARGAVRYRVDLVGSAEEDSTLAETTIDWRSPAGAESEWHEMSVSLAKLAKRSVTIRLTAEEAAGWEGVGFAAWGSPQVLSRRTWTAPNVLLISLDTLRPDRLSLYGYRRTTSPHLDRWAGRRAVVFERAVSAAPWTLPSHVSLLTGLYPFHHGVNRSGPIPKNLPLLAEMLGEAGYSTHATTAGALMRTTYGFGRGFDSFRAWADVYSNDRAFGELEAGVDRLIEWLHTRQESPFFAFLHTYEPHTPYFARQPYFDRFLARRSTDETLDAIELRPAIGAAQYRLIGVELDDHHQMLSSRDLGPDDKEMVDAFYDSSIAYLDEQLGRIFSSLEALGRDRDTVVIVTSDHGESLYDQERVGHYHLYDDNLLVPMIVAVPGLDGRGGRRVDLQVRTVDVVPTILDAVGIRAPAGLDGASLLPLMRGTREEERTAWAYSPLTNRGIAMRDATTKFILDDSLIAPAGDRVELYDLERDPHETSNLAATSHRAAAFASAARRRAARSDGIRFELSNASDTPFEVRLSGTAPTFAATTSPNLDFACCQWIGGAFDVVVEAGKRFHVILQDSHRGDLKVEILLDGAALATHHIDLDRPWRPFVIAAVDGRWRLSEGARSPSTGVSVWLAANHGSVRPRSSSNEEEEQLKALGYL